MELVLLQDCKSCGETKPLSDFSVTKKPSGRVYPQLTCKLCRNAKGREQRKDPQVLARSREYNARWRNAHREHHREVGRFARRRQKHGLSEDQIWKMLDDQGFTCPICSDPLGLPTVPRAFAVDHDHLTGAIRMLLCDRCNMGLGYFRDNPQTLDAARKYITYYNSLR